MRSVLHAASQLPGRGPIDVDIALVPACYSKSGDDDDNTCRLLCYYG